MGDMLASASSDQTVKLLDFKTGKIIHAGKTADGSKPIYHHILYLNVIPRSFKIYLLHIDSEKIEKSLLERVT